METTWVFVLIKRLAHVIAKKSDTAGTPFMTMRYRMPRVYIVKISDEVLLRQSSPQITVTPGYLRTHRHNQRGDIMSYPGGKSLAGTYQTIINQMPPHRTYVEPFLGGGAIMRLKRPARLNIGVDLELAPSVSAMVASLAISDDTRAEPEGRTTKNGEPSEKYEIKKICGISFLETTQFIPKTLIYCDPPYVMSTRSGKRIYKNEMTDQDHIRFLNVARRLDCMVMISGYMSELYADRLRDWRLVTFEAITRGGTMRTECLWMNYPEPTELHDYRYLGTDFRERERIQRKQSRWLANLKRMPLLERNALVELIDSQKRGLFAQAPKSPGK